MSLQIADSTIGYVALRYIYQVECPRYGYPNSLEIQEIESTGTENIAEEWVQLHNASWNLKAMTTTTGTMISKFPGPWLQSWDSEDGSSGMASRVWGSLCCGALLELPMLGDFLLLRETDILRMSISLLLLVNWQECQFYWASGKPSKNICFCLVWTEIKVGKKRDNFSPQTGNPAFPGYFACSFLRECMNYMPYWKDLICFHRIVHISSTTDQFNEQVCPSILYLCFWMALRCQRVWEEKVKFSLFGGSTRHQRKQTPQR